MARPQPAPFLLVDIPSIRYLAYYVPMPRMGATPLASERMSTNHCLRRGKAALIFSRYGIPARPRPEGTHRRAAKRMSADLAPQTRQLTRLRQSNAMSPMRPVFGAAFAACVQHLADRRGRA